MSVLIRIDQRPDFDLEFRGENNMVNITHAIDSLVDEYEKLVEIEPNNGPLFSKASVQYIIQEDAFPFGRRLMLM